MILFKRIINVFFKNSYTEDTQTKFYSWYLDPSNAGHKEEALKSVWDELHVYPDDTTLNSLQQVEKKVGLEKPVSSYRYNMARKYLKVAAFFALPILSVFLTYLIMNSLAGQNKEINFAECFVPYGQMRTVTLPDGTVVTINSGSVLIYPELQDGDQRYVYLNGEAYFDVKHDDKQPFVVKIDGYNVEVLGTKFNVSAYSDDTHSTTTLEEGKVSIHVKDKNLGSVILEPNQQLAYNKVEGSITMSTVKEGTIAAWKEGNYIFQRASIYDILKTFERRYDVSIYINSNRYDEDAITVQFNHGETLEESMRILKQLTPKLKYDIKDGRVYVY